MNQHGALWDLDGTIIDTFELYYTPYVQVFEEHKIRRPLFDIDIYRNRYYGRSAEGTFYDWLKDELSLEDCQELAVAYVKKAAKCFAKAAPDEIKLLPGVERILKFLQDQGYPMAVASSSWLPCIIIPLEKTGLLGCFSNIVSGFLLPSKPEPDVFRIAAESIFVQPQHCVVFEDSQAGMCGAKRAGMKCVGIASSIPANNMLYADIALNAYSELDLERLSLLLRA